MDLYKTSISNGYDGDIAPTDSLCEYILLFEKEQIEEGGREQEEMIFVLEFIFLKNICKIILWRLSLLVYHA